MPSFTLFSYVSFGLPFLSFFLIVFSRTLLVKLSTFIRSRCRSHLIRCFLRCFSESSMRVHSLEILLAIVSRSVLPHIIRIILIFVVCIRLISAQHSAPSHCPTFCSVALNTSHTYFISSMAIIQVKIIYVGC